MYEHRGGGEIFWVSPSREKERVELVCKVGPFHDPVIIARMLNYAVDRGHGGARAERRKVE